MSMFGMQARRKALKQRLPFFDVPALSAALIRGLAGDPEADRLRQAARQTIVDGYDLHRHSLPRQIAWVESHAPMG